MKKSLTLVLVTSLAATAAWASGGSKMSMPSMSQASPQDQAISSYNNAVRLRDQAWKMEKEAESTADAAKKEGLMNKVHKRYEAVVRDQSTAVQLNPQFFQAWGELGYAQRKLGNYPDALAAYDKALQLQPGYAEAIEYRGEAYLGLNRVKEAQDAYLTLFDGGDHDHAAQLANAMKTWLDQRKTAPGTVPADQIETFSKWLSQRHEISTQAGMAGGSSSWH